MVVAVGVVPGPRRAGRLLGRQVVVQVVAVGEGGDGRRAVGAGDGVAVEAAQRVIRIGALGGDGVRRAVGGLRGVLLQSRPAGGIEVVPDVLSGDGVPGPVDASGAVVAVARRDLAGFAFRHVAVGVVGVAGGAARSLGGQQLAAVVVGVGVPSEAVRRGDGGEAAGQVVLQDAVRPPPVRRRPPSHSTVTDFAKFRG